MHRRLRTIVAVSAFLVPALVGIVASPARATPPRPPLDLDLVVLESPVPGRPVPFAIVVTPLVPAERLRLRIVPPGDVALARGDTLSLVTDVVPGRAHRFEGAFRLPPGLRRHVYVRAEITTVGGTTWTRGGDFDLLAGPPSRPEPAGRIRPDGRGGSLVEYDGAGGPAR